MNLSVHGVVDRAGCLGASQCPALCERPVRQRCRLALHRVKGRLDSGNTNRTVRPRRHEKKPKGETPSNRQPQVSEGTPKRNIISSCGTLFGGARVAAIRTQTADHHDTSVASYTCCLRSSDRSCIHPSTHGAIMLHLAHSVAPSGKAFSSSSRVGLMRTVESVQTVGVYA